MGGGIEAVRAWLSRQPQLSQALSFPGVRFATFPDRPFRDSFRLVEISARGSPRACVWAFGLPSYTSSACLAANSLAYERALIKSSGTQGFGSQMPG